MAETSDHAAADGDTAASEAGADRVNLPAVVAPQLSAPRTKLKTARDMKPSKPKLPRHRSAPSVLVRWRPASPLPRASVHSSARSRARDWCD